MKSRLKMKRKLFSCAIVLLVVLTIILVTTTDAKALSPHGKTLTTWAEIKTKQAITDNTEIHPAPSQYPGNVKNGKYYPQPGHPGWGYFLYVRQMQGPGGGIEIFLLPMGMDLGKNDIEAIRLAIWTLNGYYKTGGSKQIFPDNFQYTSSIANEIKLHCWASLLFGEASEFARHANPINIEKRDHPGYKVSTWQAIQDWKNGIF